MMQAIHSFKEKLREDIKDEMRVATEKNTPGNYERVLFLLKVACKLHEAAPYLAEGHGSTVSSHASTVSDTVSETKSVVTSDSNPY